MRAPWTLLAVVLVAGCAASPPADPLPEQTPGVITDPTQGLGDTGAHIHDYWRGQDRLVVIGPEVPGDESGLGPGFATGETHARTFQPSSGNVVPQGTASVDFTFTWTDAADGLDAYGAMTAWAKTAAQNQSASLGTITNGQTLTIATTLADADLPHQLLSAWAFDLYVAPPNDGRPLRFKGEVAIEVVAVRGLELPVFPAHPDPWQGRSEIPLVEASGELSYWEDTGDGGSNGANGPITFTPRSGAIVPATASHVAVAVSWTGGVPLQLWYHDATSRTMAPVDGAFQTGSTATGTTAHYELPVGEGPDGPYATQSQWEFTVKPQGYGPVRSAWLQEYTITAAAVRLADQG